MSRDAKREPRVVFGFHAVLARLRADPAGVVEIFVDETRNDARSKDLIAAAERSKVRLMRVPTKRLDGFYGGGRHRGWLRAWRCAIPPIRSKIIGRNRKPMLLVLDGVTVRTTSAPACAWPTRRVRTRWVAAKDRAVGITRPCPKVASGAAEATPYLMVTNLARTLTELKESNIWVIGGDERAAQTLYDADLPESMPGCSARKARACGA